MNLIVGAENQINKHKHIMKKIKKNKKLDLEEMTARYV